jgi:hypothetical protein
VLKLTFPIIMLVLIVSMAPRSFMDDKKIVPLLGKQGPFGKEKSSDQIKGRTLQTSGIVGSLSIHMMRDPSFQAFTLGLTGGDRYLDLWLKGEEWGALFLDVLGCPDVTDVPRLPGEGDEEWQGRYALKFQQAIPNTPLLGRIWDVFIYVSFRPEEIEELRSECLKVRANTSDGNAQLALIKLIAACEEASKQRSGLLLVPD